MGWNGSRESANTKAITRKQSRGAFAPWHGALALLVIVIGGVIALFCSDSATSLKPAKETSSKSLAIAEVAPSLSTNVEIVAEEKPVKREWSPERKAMREKLKKMTPEERRELGYEMIKNRKIDLEPTTNRPFRTGIEYSMARIFMTRVGDAPPPPLTTMIPIQDEAHLAEILIANNPVLETDSEEWAEAKEMVELAKKEMIQYIKDGGDAESFLSFYYDKLQNAFEERRTSLKEVARVAYENPELAQEFYEQVDKRLQEKGIRGLEFSESQKTKLGLR